MQSMNENAAVIATIMKSVADFVKDVNKGAKDSYKDKKSKDKNNYLTRSSIMSASKDLVMSFPVICSTSLSADTALMIQKAIESNCVTTLQMIFASASLQGTSGVNVIKQWHNNISGDISMDDYFDYIESLGNGIDSAVTSRVFECSVDYEKKYAERMIEECKRNNVYYPISNFNESSLMSFELSNGYDGRLNIKAVNEAKNSPQKVDATPVTYTDANGYTQVYLVPNDLYKQIQDEVRKTGVAFNNSVAFKKYLQQVETDKAKIETDKEKNQIAKDDLLLKQQQNNLQYLQKQLLDSDIKKANELQPSMMIIRYTTVGKSSENINVVEDFIAGVKARLIGCDSVEIIDRVRLALENKVDLKNFLRATTGEIKFCKDFLLAIDQAKIEAKRNSKLSKTSPIWRALQNRATRSTFKRINRSANTAAAITSLVMSAEEVNRLNTLYNIDLYNVAKCRQVMEAYNFMEVVIVDEALEVARFLLDNDDKYFQDYSFTALRKEMTDSTTKKLINIMSTTNRG